MYRLILLFISFILLTGCSQNEQIKDVVQGKNIIDTLDNNGLQTKVIFHDAIAVTGAIEAYQDNPYFERLKNYSGCNVDIDKDTLSKRIYCNGISGYDHVYKIPSLNIEYIYDSETMLNYISGGYDRFFVKDNTNYPIIVSGNIMSWVDSDSYLIKHSKGVNETPKDILKKAKLDSGCDPIDLGSGLFSNYIVYSVPSYRYLGPETVPGDNDRCLLDLPIIGGGMSWAYVFSSDDKKNYYYAIGLNGGGSMPPIYTDKSLKLFVE